MSNPSPSSLEDDSLPPAFEATADSSLSFSEFVDAVSGHLGDTHGGRNLIFSACESGKLERVKWLVEHGVDADMSDAEGDTPLLIASNGWGRGFDEICVYLITLGVDLNAHSESSGTALRSFIYGARYGLALTLIDGGADAEKVNFTHLHQAAARGDLGWIKLNGCNIELEGRDIWARTPWLTALCADQVEAAQLLAELGANTETGGFKDQSPLHLCAETESIKSIEFLIDQGTDIHAITGFGDTALHRAASYDTVEAARVLLNAGASLTTKNSVGKQPINDATSLEMLMLLRNHGANLDHVDGCGDWPLKVAADRGELEIVSWLIDQGVEVNQTSTGETALHAAVRSGNLAVVSLLIDRGANVNAEDCDGWTPVFWCESLEVVRLLVSAGADLSVGSMRGRTVFKLVPDAVKEFLRTQQET